MFFSKKTPKMPSRTLPGRLRGGRGEAQDGGQRSENFRLAAPGTSKRIVWLPGPALFTPWRPSGAHLGPNWRPRGARKPPEASGRRLVGYCNGIFIFPLFHLIEIGRGPHMAF